MTDARPATIYFDPHVYGALRLKAAEIQRSISDVVNDAVRVRLAEDAEDIATFEDRAHERSLRLEDALQHLKSRGKL